MGPDCRGNFCWFPEPKGPLLLRMWKSLGTDLWTKSNKLILYYVTFLIHVIMAPIINTRYTQRIQLVMLRRRNHTIKFCLEYWEIKKHNSASSWKSPTMSYWTCCSHQFIAQSTGLVFRTGCLSVVLWFIKKSIRRHARGQVTLRNQVARKKDTTQPKRK